MEASCSYPQDSGIRRVKRTPVSAVVSRIERLERTVAALSENQICGRDQDTRSPNGSWTTEQKPLSDRHVLLNNGATSRFFSNSIFASVVEEAEEMWPSRESASVTSPESNASQTWDSAWDMPHSTAAPASNTGLAPVRADGSFPSPWQALQLWQAYVNNVDPVIKILHIPSIKPHIHAAIKDIELADKSMALLLSVVFFAAAISLDSENALRLLGCEKGAALQQFQRQVELAIAKSNVMHSPCLRSLQGLTIYLTALRAYDNSRNVWTLTGLAIRIAHSVGLHRDGSQLGLLVFEAEMRRRCWWHLLVLDTRTGEDYGLSSIGVDRSCDTSYPTNLDDYEISPEIEELPKPQDRWTEMSFSLIRIQGVDIMMRKVLDANNIDILEKERGIETFSHRLDSTFLSYSDTNAPIQKAGSIFARLVVQKANFNLQLQAIQRDSSLENPTSSIESLTKASSLIESFLVMNNEELIQGFRWLFKSYTQWFALVLVLRHLAANPGITENQRFIDITNNAFTILDEDEALHNKGTIRIALYLLRDKALRPPQLRQLSESASLVPPQFGLAQFGSENGLGVEGFSGGLAGDNMFNLLSWPRWFDIDEPL
ncbi:hypothetical protein V500_07566 [Pseudogymnoascus sp. VKM F-4518 (FW-2643)]|nr:hypothetical protein V500_07566 [Pseudogymnoascus sp. VKM F-4518 (FW-2643)]